MGSVVGRVWNLGDWRPQRGEKNEGNQNQFLTSERQVVNRSILSSLNCPDGIIKNKDDRVRSFQQQYYEITVSSFTYRLIWSVPTKHPETKA